MAQLRADTAWALLLHGTVDLAEPDDDAGLVSVVHSEQLATVLSGLPAAVLNVIVPYQALTGANPAIGPPTVAAAGPDRVAAPGTAFWPGEPPPGATGSEELLTVGRVLGAVPFFLTPDRVRELALRPGTTMYRLLVDPADGRCVERSTGAYRPDAAMRAQLLAADVTCRAPGCVTAGSVCQVDHAVEFAAGGPTSELNTELLSTPHHDLKTQKLWDLVLEPNRDVTWTTLLGRIYRTRCHDYRQYVTVLSDAVAGVEAAAEVDRPDAVSRAVYAALAYRAPGQRLHALDDAPDADIYTAGSDVLRITHTGRDGRRHNGPAPAAGPAQPGAGTPWQQRIRNDEPPPF